MTRSRFLGRAALVGSGLVVGGVTIGGLALPAASAPSSEQDQRILNFLLELEDVQSAFYAKTIERDVLQGELREFAEVLGQHEVEHVDFLRDRLGSAAGDPKAYELSDATADSQEFLATAIELEQVGLGAYAGAATNLTADALREVARIISVEARHTAWALDLADRNPSPRATEAPIDEAAARRAVEAADVVRPG